MSCLTGCKSMADGYAWDIVAGSSNLSIPTSLRRASAIFKIISDL